MSKRNTLANKKARRIAREDRHQRTPITLAITRPCKRPGCGRSNQPVYFLEGTEGYCYKCSVAGQKLLGNDGSESGGNRIDIAVPETDRPTGSS